MFITAVIIGVLALIGSVILFLEGIITLLSQNKVRRSLYCIGGSIMLLLLTAFMGLYVLSTMH